MHIPSIEVPISRRLGIGKRVVFGLAVAAALGFSSAFAATPTVHDANSAHWTARVGGAGFTPSTSIVTNQALVEVYNAADDATILKIVDISPSGCIRRLGGRCSDDGTFSAEFAMYPHPCTTRTARAYDFGSGVWSTSVNLGCN